MFLTGCFRPLGGFRMPDFRVQSELCAPAKPRVCRLGKLRRDDYLPISRGLLTVRVN